jgi:hypothetical protein
MQYSQKRKYAVDLLGGKCVRCGFKDRRALQIDHVNGNGAAERKQYGMRALEFIYERRFAGETADYQLLCANCNWIKRSERNEARIASSHYVSLKHQSKMRGFID